MQNIILFVEPNDAFRTPAKIGDILMNRFSIDENAACEILKRFELYKTSFDLTSTWVTWPHAVDLVNFHAEKKQKGMDHFILMVNI